MAKKSSFDQKQIASKELQLKVAKRWAEIMGIDPVTLKFIPKKRPVNFSVGQYGASCYGNPGIFGGPGNC